MYGDNNMNMKANANLCGNGFHDGTKDPGLADDQSLDRRLGANMRQQAVLSRSGRSGA